MEALVHQKKKGMLILVKQRQRFVWVFIIMPIIVTILFENGKEIDKFKVSSKNNNFPSQVCLGTISNKFDYVDSEEVSLKGNVYDFSVDYNAIDKSSILNIHKYLMGNNNIK